MLKDNLVTLRKLNGYSQEQVAERIGITRQAYAKWESGSTVPDIDKAAALARFYGVSIDRLMNDGTEDGAGVIPPAPPGKNIWGTVTLGERGQIVIPKAARDKFNFKGGDRLVVVSDENGIALLPIQFLERLIGGYGGPEPKRRKGRGPRFPTNAISPSGTSNYNTALVLDVA
ncbi:MAG: helix-turn-helix domain-containing protein [Candidatus Methanomethylophilaceae archaeon]|nr:helix-turn-helix domain-containing protein [Candidatus Methanomethylophilaceae archaeon]